ncbi:ABC transporter substrate-binding protein [Rothia aerolata]|uniref:ABC transporter substrate-binding protein n=1 Tax=Rothia aerolata TaxID=1812262 RepID=A0A917IPB5_9MICC|nr:ABC transporter substrate-binding protein [Rothia aerolata]GGH58693.1 ABC transporter substrate-binding protein [Rothia aerolata]
MNNSLKIFSAVAASGLLLLTGCAQGQTSAASSENSITVQNCGVDVTFNKTPERMVILKSAAVPALHDLGVMDKVAARAGAYPDEYYDQATRDELSKIPMLSDDLDASGHLNISKDAVISQQPDLVLGEVDNLDRASLSQLGIPLIEEPAMCKSGAPEHQSFESIYDQLETYGTIFDREDRAETAISDLKNRVEAVKERVGDGDGRTAAVLYPTVGGGTTYAYGTKSMAEPQLEAAGFKNVFDNVDQRVFEVTSEDLINRNPDVLILLYSEGDPQAVADAVKNLPGADSMTAVRDDQVMVQLMNFTEPATPLAVDGLEKIAERFYQ